MLDKLIKFISINSPIIFSGIGIAVIGFIIKKSKTLVMFIRSLDGKNFLFEEYNFTEEEYKRKIKSFVPPTCMIDESYVNMKKDIYFNNSLKIVSNLLIKRKYNKLIIITGASGIGKTTLLFNLMVNKKLLAYLKFKNKHLVFMNLRSIKEDETLKSRIADRFNIQNNEMKNYILLLDGLDEYKDFFHLESEDIIHNIMNRLENDFKDFFAVVLTTRKELFVNLSKYFKYSSITLPYGAQKKYTIIHLMEFDETSIKKVINKKIEKNRRSNALEIITKSHEIMKRPMMIEFMHYFFSAKHVFEYLNLYLIYETIYNEYFMWEGKKFCYRDAELTIDKLKMVFNILTEKYYEGSTFNNDYLNIKDIQDLIVDSGININLFQIINRTLLMEDKNYRFRCIHNSFFEFNYIRLYYKDILEKCEFNFRKNTLESEFFLSLHFYTYYDKVKNNLDLIVETKTGARVSFFMLKVTEFLTAEIFIFEKIDIITEEVVSFLKGCFHCNIFVLGGVKFDYKTLMIFLRGDTIKIENTDLYTFDCFKSFPSNNNIRKIILRNCRLERISYIEAFPNIEEIDVSLNEIKFLGDINLFKNLKAIDLSWNKFGNIINFSCLAHIVNNISLKLSNTLLENRHLYTIDKYKKISRLYLDNNKLVELNFLSGFRHLQYLDLSNNPLRVGQNKLIENETFEIVIKYNVENEKFYRNIMETIETDREIEYGDIEKIKNINLFEDKITNVKGIANFTNIQSISLSKNQIHLLNQGVKCNYVFLADNDLNWYILLLVHLYQALTIENEKNAIDYVVTAIKQIVVFYRDCLVYGLKCDFCEDRAHKAFLNYVSKYVDTCNRFTISPQNIHDKIFIEFRNYFFKYFEENIDIKKANKIYCSFQENANRIFEFSQANVIGMYSFQNKSYWRMEMQKDILSWMESRPNIINVKKFYKSNIYQDIIVAKNDAESALQSLKETIKNCKN